MKLSLTETEPQLIGSSRPPLLCVRTAKGRVCLTWRVLTPLRAAREETGSQVMSSRVRRTAGKPNRHLQDPLSPVWGGSPHPRLRDGGGGSLICTVKQASLYLISVGGVEVRTPRPSKKQKVSARVSGPSRWWPCGRVRRGGHPSLAKKRSPPEKWCARAGLPFVSSRG